MDRAEAIEQLRDIQRRLETERGFDEEVSHGLEDDVLCELLESLGYGDVVAEYKKTPKWYA